MRSTDDEKECRSSTTATLAATSTTTVRWPPRRPAGVRIGSRSQLDWQRRPVVVCRSRQHFHSHPTVVDVSRMQPRTNKGVEFQR